MPSSPLAPLTDLPFLARDARSKRVQWHPQHDLDSRDDAMRYGQACAEALARLALVDAQTAKALVTSVLLSDSWNVDCGEEAGLAESLACAAVHGWRAVSTAASRRGYGIDGEWRAL